MQVDKDLQSEHKDLFLEIRSHFLDAHGGICHMRTMDHGTDIGFLNGVQLEENYGLLTGTGKVMRVLPLKEFKPKIIDYYLQQTKQINAEK